MYRGTLGGDENVLILDYVASFITVYVFRDSTNQAVYLVCELYLSKDDASFFKKYNMHWEPCN